MNIYNKTKRSTIATDVKTANTFLSRMVGLLNRREFKNGEALIITHCNSIHMFFMQFPIDVIFIDKNNYVVGLTPRIRPFQLSSIFFRANRAIEVPPGTIESSHTQRGDLIEIS